MTLQIVGDFFDCVNCNGHLLIWDVRGNIYCCETKHLLSMFHNNQSNIIINQENLSLIPHVLRREPYGIFPQDILVIDRDLFIALNNYVIIRPNFTPRDNKESYIKIHNYRAFSLATNSKGDIAMACGDKGVLIYRYPTSNYNMPSEDNLPAKITMTQISKKYSQKVFFDNDTLVSYDEDWQYSCFSNEEVTLSISNIRNKQLNQRQGQKKQNVILNTQIVKRTIETAHSIEARKELNIQPFKLDNHPIQDFGIGSFGTYIEYDDKIIVQLNNGNEIDIKREITKCRTIDSFLNNDEDYLMIVRENDILIMDFPIANDTLNAINKQNLPML